VSKSAKVSLGYLSEVERGRKEASSELLAAICGALELPMSDLLREVAVDLVDLGDGPVREPFDRTFEGGRLTPAMIGDAAAELRLAPGLTSRIAHKVGEPASEGQHDSLPQAQLSALRRPVVVAA
jgi:transcriptional regulator with XRE-family HTH domain